MKKILFASTALVAAGLMTASAASASEKIKLSLGGYSKWWVVGAWQDDHYRNTSGNQNGNGVGDYNSVDVKGDNEIFFGGETKLDNGMNVGVMVELEAGGDVATTTGRDVIDKSYVYLESGFGKFIVGSESNGTALLHVMAPDAAGNIDSDGILTGGWGIANPLGTSRNFVTTAIDTDAEAEKITYVAPTFYGLTLGASYIPSSSEDNRSATDVRAQTASEIYGVGGLYANTFGAVGLKVSAGYVTYDLETGGGATTLPGKTGVNEWSAGTQISFGNWTIGGSYRDRNGDEALATNLIDVDGQAWDAGIMYAQGPWAVSFFYFNSQVEGSRAISADDEFTVYQVSGKYTMGPGVDVLASVGHAEYDSEQNKVATGDANHNKGWAVMTGLGLTF